MIDTPNARDRDTLRAVFAGEGDPSRVDLEVRLSGGAPSERYEFDAKIPGSGKVTGRMRDELAGQDQPFTRELDSAGRRDLLSRLSQTDLLYGPPAAATVSAGHRRRTNPSPRRRADR